MVQGRLNLLEAQLQAELDVARSAGAQHGIARIGWLQEQPNCPLNPLFGFHVFANDTSTVVVRRPEEVARRVSDGAIGWRSQDSASLHVAVGVHQRGHGQILELLISA